VLVGRVCVMQVSHTFVSLLVIVWLGRKRDMYLLFAREKFTEVKHGAVANACIPAGKSSESCTTDFSK